MRNVITVLLLTASLNAFSQINVNAGFIGNATPQTTMGFNIGVSYEIPKTKDLVGYMVMENSYKAYYIPYYGTKLGPRTRFLSGINFVNDYSGSSRVLSQTFAVGVNYDFKPVRRDDIFNFYTGFMYTHNYFLARFGFNMEAWSGKKKKRKS